MTLVTAILARNEAGPDRYLPRVLTQAVSWSDHVLVLDDQSTDATAAIARAAGAEVVMRTGEVAWGHEASARQELWDLACTRGTWVLIQDADMLLSADPRPLCASTTVTTWCWRLYDLWDSETTYRADGFWQAHHLPRPWLVRPGAGPWTWPDRGLHVGHLPANWPREGWAVAPAEYFWRHLAYVTPAHRAAKHAQYLSHADHLTDAERAHAESILA